MKSQSIKLEGVLSTKNDHWNENQDRLFMTFSYA